MARIGNQLSLLTADQPTTSTLNVPPDLKEYEELEKLLEDYNDQQREISEQRCRTARELIMAEWREGERPSPSIIESIIFSVCFQ